MGIGDMLISESQEPATEQRDERLVKTEEDEELEQVFEKQQAASMNSQEDLHAQSNYTAEIAAPAQPGTATTTAAAQANRTTSRKRTQYFDERIEWVNMDLVELEIVAVPRTTDTPMLTLEKYGVIWRAIVACLGNNLRAAPNPPQVNLVGTVFGPCFRG
jgi:hypothetical protein